MLRALRQRKENRSLIIRAFRSPENSSTHSNMAAPKTEPAVHLSARFEGSFAYKTVKDRLPVILTKVIDHLSRKASYIESSHGPTGREEVKQTIGRSLASSCSRETLRECLFSLSYSFITPFKIYY